MKKITWNLQENVLNDDSIKQLIDFIKTTDRYTQFKKVKEFEAAWSKWQGCKYSVFVNSGSSANLVILDLLREFYKWKVGDEIIVPAVTWVTDISSVIQLGLKPVFVDINLTDFSFNYEKLVKKITRKTRGIFLTHLIGFPANIQKVQKIIGNRNIALIEDCCEAHGAKINGKKVGSFGICSSFSFYWGHHMTTVEGGMICTDNEKVYKLALLKRSHGLARELPKKFHAYYKNKHKTIDFNFLFLTTGFNVRNTELHATLGLSQIEELSDYIRIRNANHKAFIKILEQFNDYFLIPSKTGISSFCLPFLFKNDKYKKPLQKLLTRSGIESRPIISGNLLKQPFLKKYIDSETFPNADFVHKNGFYVGNNQFVNKKRLRYLHEVLKSFFEKNG